MNLKNLSAMWEGLAPTLGNHLWQSTLFVMAAGLLTLLLRKNQARTRYWLWMAASVKFLVPFSLLASLGSYLSWSRGPAGANTGLYVVMEEVSQPFTQTVTPVISPAAPSAAFPGLVHLIPVILTAAWFCGFLAVILVWCVRWRRVSANLRESEPLLEGREVEALRRLERRGWIQQRQPVEMRLSEASVEPGIFGIARPVLVWPKGISGHLEDAHLEAILAHEVWHVRRRDNLAAVVHMVVEAVFWFHPLVWWLGARLVEERERACDEEVLELGSDRQVYAESILKVCEFCVGSPLACVAGVTGADLKKRIVNIMTERTARKLNFGRKLLLGAVAALALAGPVVYGLIKPTQSRAQSQQQSAALAAPAVPVALSQPDQSGIYKVRMMDSLDGFTATGITLREVIQLAYGVDDKQIAGGPNWLGSERFDINAKVNGAAAGEPGRLSGDQRDLENHRRLQLFLADHFKLALHRETRDLPVYALVISPNGLRLHEARPGDTYSDGVDMGGRKGAGLINLEPDQITGQGVPLSSLTGVLSRRLGRTVVDRTGLKGSYDFKLHWTPTENPPQSTESSAPAIVAAVQEQLGLKLEAETIPLETLVIDRVEKPSLPQARNTAATGLEVALIKENTTGEPMPPFHIVGKPFVAFMFKSDRFMATNATLLQLLQRAYSIESDQVAGGPDWIKSVPYDVDVKPDKSSLDAIQKLGGEEEQLSEWKRALQTLFAERFKLALHRETRELPVYALVIAQKGPKLKEAKPGDTYPDGVKRNNGSPQGPGLWVPGPGQLTGQGVSLGVLKGVLSSRLRGRVVLDKTGLTGNYDFTLHWTPAEGGADSSAAILTAIQELGLKLEPQKAPMEVLVIDHAEKPAEK